METNAKALLEQFSTEATILDKSHDRSWSYNQGVMWAIINALATLGDESAIVPLTERYISLNEQLKTIPSTITADDYYMFDVLVTGEQWPNPEFEAIQSEILDIDGALRQLRTVLYI